MKARLLTRRQGDDEAILPHINSCSIACGFHAGDPMVMYKTVKAAQRHGVRIGAHPSFLDLQGFGRREMKMDALECEKMVVYQIGALKAFLDIEGIPLSHVSVSALPTPVFPSAPLSHLRHMASVRFTCRLQR